MTIKTWQAVLFPALVSSLLVFLELPEGTRLTTACFSLAAGVAALAMMAIAALLGSRWSWLESLLGGLDRLYLVHKWLGIWALGLASFHLVFKAGLGSWDTASILSLSPFLTRLVRQLSFVALMFIILLALDRKIPYHQWRWWHKLSGPLFLIVILHWLSFKSPIALASPAGIWLAALSALGVMGAAYKLLLYPFLAKHGEYCLTRITPGPHAACLEFQPVKAPISFKPGQFGFLRMKEDGLREPHPFTIASASNPDGRVVFLIRSLGDFTQKLIANASPGMYADIYAAYGRFQRPQDQRREIWIGGGVGISPFVSWLQDETATGFERVTLFYFCTPGREFPSIQDLQDMAAARGAEFIPVTDGAASALFRQRMTEIAKAEQPQNLHLLFCGPQGLQKTVRGLMEELAIPARQLQHEYFEFR